MSRGHALSDRQVTAGASWHVPETADCELVPVNACAYGASGAPHHSDCCCEPPGLPGLPDLPSHMAESLRSITPP